MRVSSASKKVTASRGHEAGFSLVEVLVTLSIVALASAMIVATARPADALKSEHDKLASVLKMLDARAKVSGEPTGLIASASGYTPATWRAGEWQVLQREHRKLPDQFNLRIEPGATSGPQVQFDPLMPGTRVAIVLSDGRRDLTVAYPGAEAR